MTREHAQWDGFCRHVCSRTGNGLTELVYYIAERDQFMQAVNTAVADRQRYPIEITFYEDRDDCGVGSWADAVTLTIAKPSTITPTARLTSVGLADIPARAPCRPRL